MEPVVRVRLCEYTALKTGVIINIVSNHIMCYSTVFPSIFMTAYCYYKQKLFRNKSKVRVRLGVFLRYIMVNITSKRGFQINANISSDNRINFKIKQHFILNHSSFLFHNTV